MGMYDTIIAPEIKCPECGAAVTEFQSKSGPCEMLTFQHWQIYNFYASCPGCDAWIEFNRVPPKVPIPNYEMTVITQKEKFGNDESAPQGKKDA